MLEILQFIFSSFWVWLGFTTDIFIISYTLMACVGATAVSKAVSDENEK